MRFARVFFCLVLVLNQAVLFVPAASADDVPMTGGVVISQMYPGTNSSGALGKNEIIEIYNNTDAPVEVTGWCVKYLPYTGNLNSDSVITACLVSPSTSTQLWLAARGYAVFVSNELNQLAPVHADIYFNGGIAQTRGYVQLVNAQGAEIDKLGWGSLDDKSYPASPKLGHDGDALLRRIDGVVMQDTGNDANDFVTAGPPFVVRASNVYEQEIVMPSEPTVDCKGIIINEIGANLTDQFVELYNGTDASVQLAGCKLQTNRNSTIYSMTKDALAPGEYLLVPIAGSGLTLTKTTSGTVYLLSSDGQTEDDAVSYSNLISGTSWSRFVDGWRQTYTVTPGAENVDQPYLPCVEGYYRNLATGRCNIIPVDSPLAACAADQYRNPETGRCKKIETVTRKPCRDDQYRSEETGRCRNIVLASTKKPCKDNQYRSEETGRCRNVPTSTVPDAAFAVQPIKDTGMAFVGWWALAGVGLVAAGYGVWEWRCEIAAFWQRLIKR